MEAIQAGFRDTGVFPFDPERTYRHLNGISDLRDSELTFNLNPQLDKNSAPHNNVDDSNTEVDTQSGKSGRPTLDNSFCNTFPTKEIENSFSPPIEILEDESTTTLENQSTPNGETAFEVSRTPSPELFPADMCSPELDDVIQLIDAFDSVFNDDEISMSDMRQKLKSLKAESFYSFNILALRRNQLLRDLKTMAEFAREHVPADKWSESKTDT